jgi:hypothetical protein
VADISTEVQQKLLAKYISNSATAPIFSQADINCWLDFGYILILIVTTWRMVDESQMLTSFFHL